MIEFIQTRILTPEFYDTYIPYGNLDNIVVILGALLGHKIEKYIPQKLQSGLGAVWGGGIANAIFRLWWWNDYLVLRFSLWNSNRLFDGINFNPNSCLYWKINKRRKI